MNIVRIDGIPVYQALVTDENTGMLRISLVDDPAVQSNFLAFQAQKKDKAPLLYAVQSEERRLVLGVVMRADFPIYRRDKDDNEYYVIYKADTIRIMAEKYLAENRQNIVNLMHVAGSEVEGVNMVQYFLKGAGLVPSGFEDIADGSLFAEFHVTNDEVWDAIKDGTYKGFSLEGIFDLEPEQNKSYVEEVVDILQGAFSRIFKNQPKIYEKMKRKGLLARLARALVEMGNITTDKGILAWDGDEDLKAGDSVYLEDADGNRSTPEDGDYTTSDGKVIVVAGGKVSEIRDPEAEVAPTGEGESFSSVETDNGTLEWDGDEDLREGDAVYIRNDDGERVAAPDGDYVTRDGKTITVVDGVVAALKDAEAEVAPQDLRSQKFRKIVAAFSESYEDKIRRIYEAIVAFGVDPYGYLIEAGDDYAVYCIYGEAGEKFLRFEVSWDAEGNPVVSNPVEVRPAFVEVEKPAPAAEPAEIEELRRQNAELKAQVEQYAATPAGREAHEESEAVIPETGDRRLDRLSRIMRAH